MRRTEFGSASLGALLALLAALACERGAAEAGAPNQGPDGVVLARVGDGVITEEELGWLPVTVKPERELEKLVMRRLAANEARRRGLHEVPKTREKIADLRRTKLMREEILLRNALYNSIRLGLEFNENELRAHFELNQKRYTAPQWTLRVRKFASEAEARAALTALGATGRLDPAQSDTLGPAPAQQLPADLLPNLHLFKQPGDRHLLDLADGWSLIELAEYLPDAPLSFEAAREKVDQTLRAIQADEHLNAELDRLRAEQVAIDAAALANLEKLHAERVVAARAARAAKAAAEAAAAEAP